MVLGEDGQSIVLKLKLDKKEAKMTESVDDFSLISKIRDSLGGEERSQFEKLASIAMHSSALSFIKKFLNQYDSDDSFDNTMLCVMSQVLKEVGTAITNELKEKQEPLSTQKVAEILSKKFREIAREIEEAHKVLRVVK